MIGLYAQATKSDRIGILQSEINSLLEIDPPKVIPIKRNEAIEQRVPAWLL